MNKCVCTEGDEVVVRHCGTTTADDCAQVIGCRHPCEEERGGVERGGEEREEGRREERRGEGKRVERMPSDACL